MGRRDPVRAVRLTDATLPHIFEWAPGKYYWQGQPLDVTGYRVFTGRGTSQVAAFGDLIVERGDGTFYAAPASDPAALAVEVDTDALVPLAALYGAPVVNVVETL